jgi:cell division protein FtsZ
MMFSFVDNEKSAKIKVVGVGGAGGNAINNMINARLQGCKFISVNTGRILKSGDRLPWKA